MATEASGSRPAEILLVEDNDNDVVLTREGFRLARFAANLHHVPDGEECMAFLRKQGRYAGAPTPDLVLLDLNMPRKDGSEVLAEMIADDQLKHLPVIVLTTSRADTDVLRMYQLRCSAYMVKPVDFEKLVEAIKVIGKYWFTLVVLPGSAAGAAPR
jgi:two-component system, chemotaxis family, response regulator Rcp1